MEYNKLTLKDIEKAYEQVFKETKPLFEVTIDTTGLYKISCGDTTILCSEYLLYELDSAIRKGLCFERIGELEYNPLK